MKKKISKSKNVGAIKATYENGNWKTKSINPEQLLDMFEEIRTESEQRQEQKFLPIEKLSLFNVKIIVAVAESPQWGWNPRKTKKLETGRAMAQAAHAVSKLKLSYAMWLSQEDVHKCYSIVQKIINQPITTIIVKARNTDELLHIAKLANAKDLHNVSFQDENEQFYGTTEWPLTAVAIGPYLGDRFNGITDYLPLWKSPDEL